MKKLFSLLAVAAVMLTMTSCATIIGGTRYNAKVLVPNHPNASISYNGEFKGTGEATFSIPRRQANKVSITVQDEGCEPYTKTFTKRSVRAWPLVADLTLLSGYLAVNGEVIIPYLPTGAIVDWAAGGWWKPSIKEEGVSQESYKNFNYVIDYHPEALGTQSQDVEVAAEE